MALIHCYMLVYRDGVIMGRGAEWVKAIDLSGQIRSLDWSEEYGAPGHYRSLLHQHYHAHACFMLLL
jgi:hypothetical protein